MSLLNDLIYSQKFWQFSVFRDEPWFYHRIDYWYSPSVIVVKYLICGYVFLVWRSTYTNILIATWDCVSKIIAVCIVLPIMSMCFSQQGRECQTSYPTLNCCDWKGVKYYMFMYLIWASRILCLLGRPVCHCLALNLACISVTLLIYMCNAAVSVCSGSWC